ncbi:aldo/keto reductase [Mycetocola tolaasinivorans]|uniref:Aldo/keto reductase n=1 Tax=Mycetocola tolaasinivorans TaxID=76635 RepID=A0A3L7AAX2_9MICO|nr:aldo/keto reductase [Mycetocola tolaasinivorans]RLP76811.1 aldo/keto reductase [Mycetocola tolaasinivorans]
MPSQGWTPRPLGVTGLLVSPVTLGGGPLGSMPENFGYAVSERAGIDLVRAVLASEIRSIDTANGYSQGESERRIGIAIAEQGGLPDDVLVMTKVDALDRDFSADRVRRSLAESRERLGVEVLPMVHLHDPEYFDFAEIAGPGGAIEALVDARERGEVGHIGLAGGDVHQMSRYLELGMFEVLLVHNRFTLVDRSANGLVDRARELGVGVVNAAVLGGGILADVTGTRTDYGYRPASPETLHAIAEMRRVCANWDTDLATAAVAFSVRDTRFATTIVGISKPERIAGAIAAASLDRPEEFWQELDALLPDSRHWLDAAPHA